MNLSPKRLVTILEEHGYVLKRITGSHHIYFHPETKVSVPVPIHGNKDIPQGTFLTILKQAGIDKAAIG